MAMPSRFDGSPHPGTPRRPLLARSLSALPDGLTAALAAWVWLDPSGWRRELVGCAVLTLLIEFVMIHASGFFGMVLDQDRHPTNPDRGPSQGHAIGRRRRVIGLLLFYALMVGGFAASFDRPWVLLGAIWLLLLKAWPLLIQRSRPLATRAQRGMWAAATVHYLLAVGATTVLPVPRLGVVGSGADYGMQGQSGLWVSEPQTAIAALMLYFALLGLTRLCGWDTSWGRQAERQPRPSLDA